ncbi:cation diffusion facilitator family transporter [Campylobacter fetus]|uniref:cation diffusion facilitator family transporter n=1 Tax=Campylobacter fetus TaxID=196 RepID=UPI00138E33C4|nr:cation transporter [Campylobacter fetus]
MQLGKATQNYGKKIRDNKPQDIEFTKENISRKEQFVLKVSMYCALILAIFGVGFGLFIKSLTIVFDGIIALVSVGLGLLSVVTARYVYKEDDDIFQYGYIRFEPMVNLFKSLILLIVCLYAFFSAIKSIFSGGYTLELGAAVIYTMVAFVLCFIIFTYTSFYSKYLGSELIYVDRAEWLIDCVLYCGGIIAFGLIYIFDPTQEKWFSSYIDPILLVLFSIFLSVAPLKIFISNLKDLIMVAPGDLDDKITEIMQSLSLKYGFSDYDTHVAKSGRFFMIEVNILSTSSNDILSVKELDCIRNEIEQRLEIPSYKIWLLVSLTANPKWL